MGVQKSPRRLNGNGEKPRLLFFVSSTVKSSVCYTVPQAAAVHPFGKNTRNAAYIPDIEACHHIGMKGKPDPGFTLPDEDFLAPGASLSKVFGLRPFHGHDVAVFQMADAPYTAHTAFDGAGEHLVGAHQSIVLMEPFRRDHILPVQYAAVNLVQGSFTYRKINAIQICHSISPLNLTQNRPSSPPACSSRSVLPHGTDLPSSLRRSTPE